MSRNASRVFLATAVLLAVAATVVPLGGCRRGPGGPRPSEADKAGSIESGGRTRSYLVHVPPSYDGRTPYPLVLAFHGHGGQGENQERLSGMETVSDLNAFILAYPDGIDRGWNDGRGIHKGIDDVGFARGTW